MTVRELDDHIQATLALGRCNVATLYHPLKGRCTLYDLLAALGIWERNGWAVRSARGLWSLTAAGGAK